MSQELNLLLLTLKMEEKGYKLRNACGLWNLKIVSNEFSQRASRKE